MRMRRSGVLFRSCAGVILAGLLPAAVAPLAWAQQPSKTYRVAMFHPTESHSGMSEQGGLSQWQALFRELRSLGYEEGRNLKVERYSGRGQEETYPQLARKVVASQPDLIFAWGTEVQFFADAAAGKVPILTFVADPMAAGLSTSLSRPSANVTGIVADVGAGIVGKRFQMLREIRPETNHVAMLVPQRFWEAPQNAPAGLVRQIARQSAMRLICLCLASPIQEAAYRQAFADLH